MHYLDQASTSFPKPERVARRIVEYLTEFGVNPGRGSSDIATKAHQMVENTRQMLANLIGAKKAEHVVFTTNATHSLNMVMKGFLKSGDHVILCRYSHNAALRPLECLRREHGITYDILPVDEAGQVDLLKLQALIRPTTRLMIATEASNVIGVLADFKRAYALCQQQNIAILLDSTQSLGYSATDLENTPIDFLVGTGHKTLLGPTGIGFLHVKNPESLHTFIEGGSPGNSSFARQHPESMPYKFEAGTQNATGVAGLMGALEYIEKKGLRTMAREALALTELSLRALLEIEELTIYGTLEMAKKIPIISFNIKGMLPAQVAHELEKKYGISTRAGLHCAPLMHEMLGTLPTGSVRVSFGHQNTEEDMQVLVKALQQMVCLEKISA